MTGTEAVAKLKARMLAALEADPGWCEELRPELPGIRHWFVRLGQGLAREGTPCDPGALKAAIEEVTTAIAGGPTGKRGKVSGRKARAGRRRRYWNAHEAAVMMGRGRDEGRCPNCGSDCETFISRVDPDIDGIRFSCAACDPEAAAVIDWAAQMRRASQAHHEEQARRN
jgi:hypothetical protein